ncbi:MAG: class I adenylate-forming enzyme family protein [Bacillota bacterium]|nr:class I adenylate-forming enzyme family protein [Bacillota bacterium]
MSIQLDDLKNLTIPELFETICKRNPDKQGLVFDEDIYTYRDFYKKVNTLAASLINLGISKGDRVALMLPNCAEYIISYFALFQIGAWPVPISTRWEKDEIANVLMDAQSCAVIFVERQGALDYIDIVSYIQEKLPILKKLILLNNPDKCKEIGAINFSELLEWETDIEITSDVQPDDVSMLSYTSGTTGNPKGVMLTHKNLVLISIYSALEWKMTENDTPLSIAPLYSAQGFLSVLLFLSSCGTVKYLTTFNPNMIIKAASKGINTVMHTQPTMWSLILGTPAIRFSNFSSYNNVVVSGSVCSSELAKRIEETIKCPVYNAYGLIEATSVVTMTKPGDSEEIRLNTVGRPIPGVSIKIVDENRCEIPKGEVGELAVKGYLMKGYLNNIEKTREVIDDDGWLYTGDLAKYYDDENISIVGRCKDMIIRGGFNIYPIDIEEVIMQHPDVYDVAVVGRDHDVVGEQTIAFVIPKPGKTLDKSTILKHCVGKIANYKIPDDVIFISQMPIILSGKVQKKLLKQWAQEGTPAEALILFNEDKGE